VTSAARTAIRGRGVADPLFGAVALPTYNQPSVVPGRAADDTTVNRSTAMQLMHEDLARAHMNARLEEAARARRAHRLLAARRAQRRAERAAARARAALALAVHL
jgi:hypothetical protein